MVFRWDAYQTSAKSQIPCVSTDYATEIMGASAHDLAVVQNHGSEAQILIDPHDFLKSWSLSKPPDKNCRPHMYPHTTTQILYNGAKKLIKGMELHGSTQFLLQILLKPPSSYRSQW